MTTTDGRPARQRAIGVYLGGVQFFFAATWIVYVIYIPQLVAQAGLPKSAVLWILMADQVVFFLADYASGVAADRAGRVVGRLGAVVLAATLVSCIAFFALPYVAGQGSVALLGVLLVWAVTSSALRAPPLALIGKYVAWPSQPVLLALSLAGLGIANAFAPYLGMTLRDLDPRMPFAISSAALALMTIGLVTAERVLARMAGTGNDLPTAKVAPAASGGTTELQTPWMLLIALAAALAFQVHVFIDSGPAYLRHAPRGDLPTLLPVFWIGFNLGMFPFSAAARRIAVTRLMGAAALLAAIASAATTFAPDLTALVVAQLVAGAAWGCIVVSAFAWSLQRGGEASSGRFAGAVSSVLALATLLRIGGVVAGWPQEPTWRELLVWWPAVGWLIAGVVVLVLLTRRKAHAHAGAA